MAWKVGFSSKAAKQARKLAKRERILLTRLVTDLSVRGAVQPEWPNYSKLEDNAYHCHLNYRWVACWKVEDNRLRIIEIYYVGSRENAPY
jgi:mRNA-degrading endonuclease RelE of RelBE toxin-antitoxin system